ncbi:hypothetical protein [Brevundimonas sp. DWR2-3-1b1]|uniref:hypothetical protein n=1 Tax=unclassified Brevundimonas TaxID=2622653 RepID=UPI003CEB1304
MADVKVSALPAATALTRTEEVPVIQGGASVRTTVSAMGPKLHPGYSSTRVYSGNWGVLTNNAPPYSGYMFFHPVFIPVATTIKSLILNVSSAQGGGSTAYVGLYSSLANGNPGSALIRSTSLSTSTAGAKVYTLGSPLAVAAGTYWGATWFSATGGTVYSYNYQGIGSWAVGASQSDYLIGATVGLMDQSGTNYSSGLPSNAITGFNMSAMLSIPIPAVQFGVN